MLGTSTRWYAASTSTHSIRNAHDVLDNRFRKQANRHLSGEAQRCSTSDAQQPTPQPRGGSLLRTYGRDLTQEAREGRLDPLVGRSDVLARTLQVLLRRTKNNPLLVGDPGVGKTAVVEGLAQLLISADAPPAYVVQKLIRMVFCILHQDGGSARPWSTLLI